MRAFFFILATLTVANAFMNNVVKSSSIALNAAKSKSVPFLDVQPALAGSSMAGNAQFDPLGFTGQWLDKDWSQQIVPDIWIDGAGTRSNPVTTIEWMREAELKHGRVCMMAVIGWLAVDSGLRLPGSSFASIPNSFAAHTGAVSNGSMGFLLLAIGVLELVGGAAIYDQSKGSGRTPGDYSFDPLGLGKDKNKLARYSVSEIKNGRLAMLAFSGIVTAQAVFPDRAFPFI